ncbi:MAG: hypothetical protein IKQ39_05600 [Oscillospiraceae bacterium]|nr:hypothetical protein [Oscillospiraceae bacterium]
MGQTSMSGRQTVLMDQRGRISFPSGFRASIGEVLYISPAQDERPVLVVRSAAGFDAECDRIRAVCTEAGFDEEDTVDEVRDFTMDTVRISPDKNGRITLPAELIRYAGFTDKVVVVGVQDFAELWDEKTLAAHEAARRQLRQLRRRKKEAAKAARLTEEV